MTGFRVTPQTPLVDFTQSLLSFIAIVHCPVSLSLPRFHSIPFSSFLLKRFSFLGFSAPRRSGPPHSSRIKSSAVLLENLVQGRQKKNSQPNTTALIDTQLFLHQEKIYRTAFPVSRTVNLLSSISFSPTRPNIEGESLYIQKSGDDLKKILSSLDCVDVKAITRVGVKKREGKGFGAFAHRPHDTNGFPAQNSILLLFEFFSFCFFYFHQGLDRIFG